MQPGDIILQRGHDLIGLLIRQATCSPVSHAMLVDSCGKHVIEATRSGVHVSPLPTLTDDDFVLPCPDATAGLAAARYAEQRVGAHYGWLDFPGILRRLLHLATRKTSLAASAKEAVVCSTLVTEAWRRAGMDPAPGVPDVLVTPADLFLTLARR